MYITNNVINRPMHAPSGNRIGKTPQDTPAHEAISSNGNRDISWNCQSHVFECSFHAEHPGTGLALKMSNSNI
jgi:hypothetical protein